MKKSASATLDPSQREPKYRRLTRADDVLILRLSAEGKTLVEIAQRFAVHHSSIGRVLAEYEDTTELAKLLTRNRAKDIARAAIDGSIKAADDCKPEHALELLDRLDVAPKRQATSTQAQVNIVIGMPGQPAGPRPVIDTQALE